MISCGAVPGSREDTRGEFLVDTCRVRRDAEPAEERPAASCSRPAEGERTRAPPHWRIGGRAMKATRLFRTLGVATGLTVAWIALAGAALAEPFEHGKFHEETTDMVEDFCDVPGFTVQFDRVADVTFLGNPHGPDGLVYFLEHLRVTDVWTNLANGNAVTTKFTLLSKDLQVTDNGDRTRSTTSSSSSSASSRNRPDGPRTSARPPSRYSWAEGQAKDSGRSHDTPH